MYNNKSNGKGIRFELINEGKYNDRILYNGDLVYYDSNNKIIKQGETITVRINNSTIMKNVLFHGITDDNDFGIFEFRIPNAEHWHQIYIDEDEKVEIID